MKQAIWKISMKRKNQYVKKLAIFVLCINLLCTTIPVHSQQSVLREKAYIFAKDFALGGLATVGSLLVGKGLSYICLYNTKDIGIEKLKIGNHLSIKIGNHLSQNTQNKLDIITVAGALGVRLLVKLAYDLVSKGSKSLRIKEYIRNLVLNIFGFAGFFSSNRIETMLLGAGLGNSIGGLTADYVLSKQVQENSD